MTRRCLVWILTGHLYLRPPLDDRSHPVPRHTLVEAGVAPLQRRDGHPGHAQGREEQAGWSGFFFFFLHGCAAKTNLCHIIFLTYCCSSHFQKPPHQHRSTADLDHDLKTLVDQFEEPPKAIGMQHCAYEILMLVSSFKDLWD